MSFVFRPKKEAPNWDALRRVDMQRLIQTNDVVELEKHLGNLMHANLSRADLEKIGCPNLIKLFKVGQLSLEYLVFAQQYSEAALSQSSQEYEEDLQLC